MESNIIFLILLYESSGENFNGSLYQKYFITKRRGLPDDFGQEYIDELKNVHGIMDELLFDELKKYLKITFYKYHSKNIVMLSNPNGVKDIQ